MLLFVKVIYKFLSYFIYLWQQEDYCLQVAINDSYLWQQEDYCLQVAINDSYLWQNQNTNLFFDFLSNLQKPKRSN